MFRSALRPVSIITLLILGSVTSIASPPQMVFRTLKGQRLNELAMWDLGGDGVFEVFTTSVSGDAGCYQADTLDPLWSTNYNGETLTAPVIGDFLGNGAPVMAFASSSGTIHFVWPGSGEIITSIKSSESFSMAPSVAEFTRKNHDELVLASDSGKVLVYELTPEGNAKESAEIANTVANTTAFSIIGSIVQPPSCADLNHDGIPEVVVMSDSGYIEVISLTNPPTRSFARLPQQTQATTLAGLGPVTGSTNHDIVLGVNAGLWIFNWEQGSEVITQFMQTPALGTTLGHIILTPLNHDNSSDIVSTANNVVAARYVGEDMNGQKVLLDVAQTQLTTAIPSFVPAIPFRTSGNLSGFLAIDGKGSIIKWDPLAATNAVQELGEIEPPTAFTPAGNFTPDTGLSLVSWNEKTNVLSMVPTGIKSGTASPPSLTIGINYSRNGQWGPAWEKQWQTKMQKAASLLESTKASAQDLGSDTASPLDHASILRGIAPLDATAQRFAKSLNSLLYKVAAGIAGLMLIAGGVMLFRRLR